MRILKWSLLVLFVLILLPLIGLATLIAGLWSYDFKVAKDSFLLETIRERTGYEIIVTSPVRVVLSKEFSLLGENMTVRAAPGSAAPNLAEIGFLSVYGDVDFRVLWGQNPDITKFEGKDITINLERSKKGDFILPKVAALFQERSDSASLIAPAWADDFYSSYSVPFHDLILKNIMVNITDDVQPVTLSIATLEARKPIGSSDGYLKMQGDYSYNAFSADVDITQHGVISGTGQFSGTDVSLSGQVVEDIKIDSVVNVSSTLALSRLLGQPLPPGPFSIESKLHYDHGRIKVALERLQASKSLLNGVINFSLKGRALTAELQGTELDVADFLPVDDEPSDAAQDTGASRADNSDQRVIPDITLPDVLLQKYLLPEYADAKINVNLGALRIGKVLLQEVKAKIVAHDRGGEIDIDQATLGLGGKIAGQVGVKVGKKPELITDVRFQTTPISTFQPFVPALSRLDGVVNLELKGAAAGTNLRALVADYDGDIKFSLYDGYVHLPDEAARLLATVAPAILDEGLLIVKCADFQSSLREGVDPNFDGVLLSRAMLAFGGGAVDLATEQLNLRYQNEMSVLGATFGLPLDITGAFAAPDFAPNLKAFLAAKRPDDIARPDRLKSPCHSEVSAGIKGKYSAAPAMLKLDGLGNLKNIGAIKETITDNLKEKAQEKVQQIKQKAVEKVIEKTLDSGSTAKVKELIGNNLDQDKIDVIEEAGKKLLGGLKF